MSSISIDPKHKELDWRLETVSININGKLWALRKTTLYRQIWISSDSRRHVPQPVPKGFNLTLLAARMENDEEEAWTVMRESWDNLACDPSYDPYSFTPPLSPLDPPKQGRRNDIESDEDLREPCTLSSQIFGKSNCQTFNGAESTVKVVGTDPFTPLNSAWPSPLFSDRTPPTSKKSHISKINFLGRKKFQTPNHSKIMERRLAKQKRNSRSGPEW